MSEEANTVEALDTTLAAVALRITPTQAKMLSLLWHAPIVPSEKLSALTSNVSVAVYRLRERLGVHGVCIESRQGLGYMLTMESRDAIRARMKKFAALTTAA